MQSPIFSILSQQKRKGAIMAREITIKGIALEINRRESNGKAFESLILFEPGQKYPSLVKLFLKPEQVSEASTLFGKSCVVLADMSEYEGRVNYYFRGVTK